jgi:SAM-dependent methyltransferase
MNSHNTLEAYSAIAPLYSEYSGKRQTYLDAIDALVISYLKPGMRLLDVGAGDGRRLLKIISATGIKDYVAIEPSPGMAKVCEERTGVKVHQVCAENLGDFDIGKFDVVTALWNVFGHIPTSVDRLAALKNLALRLNPGGRILLDVNNRHNAASYGFFNFLCRVVVDSVCFDERRGDATYEWKIGNQIFKGAGHLFTPAEIENLFRQAGLKIAGSMSINYETGSISKSLHKGQLFYILTHADQ